MDRKQFLKILPTSIFINLVTGVAGAGAQVTENKRLNSPGTQKPDGEVDTWKEGFAKMLKALNLFIIKYNDGEFDYGQWRKFEKAYEELSRLKSTR